MILQVINTEFRKFNIKLRNKNGESLRDMATKLGVTASYLSAVEHGKKRVTEKLEEDICRVYNLSRKQVEELRESIIKSSVTLNLNNLTDIQRQLIYLVYLKLDYLSSEDVDIIKKILEGTLSESSEYAIGYHKAIEDINTPKRVIIKEWNPSECPACHHDFSDYEMCNDGYYTRAESLSRCPYCGQLILWRD